MEPPREECTFAPGPPGPGQPSNIYAFNRDQLTQRPFTPEETNCSKHHLSFGLTCQFSVCFSCITCNSCHWKESDVTQVYHHPIWYISWSIIWSNLSPKELYVLDPIRPDSATTKNAILSAKGQEVYLRCCGRTREVGGATRGRCKCVHIWAILSGALRRWTLLYMLLLWRFICTWKLTFHASCVGHQWWHSVALSQDVASFLTWLTHILWWHNLNCYLEYVARENGCNWILWKYK